MTITYRMLPLLRFNNPKISLIWTGIGPIVFGLVRVHCSWPSKVNPSLSQSGSASTYVYTYMFVCMCVCVCMYVYIYVSMYVYVCMCVCRVSLCRRTRCRVNMAVATDSPWQRWSMWHSWALPVSLTWVWRWADASVKSKPPSLQSLGY